MENNKLVNTQQYSDLEMAVQAMGWVELPHNNIHNSLEEIEMLARIKAQSETSNEQAISVLNAISAFRELDANRNKQEN